LHDPDSAAVALLGDLAMEHRRGEMNVAGSSRPLRNSLYRSRSLGIGRRGPYRSSLLPPRTARTVFRENPVARAISRTPFPCLCRT
jgi:hypothetical protein